MANSRIDLHEELVDILQTRNVYFQPPESTKLSFPAIIYSRLDIDNRFANNEVYAQLNKYRVIVVDSDPDSLIVKRMSKFKTAKYERNYKVHGLNHDVFSIAY